MINKSKLKIFYVFFLIFINFIHCDNINNHLFHLEIGNDKKNDIRQDIIEDLLSDNTQKRRNAILMIKELEFMESKSYLENIIMNPYLLLNDRLLAASTYVELFKEDSINLADRLMLNYSYNNTSVAVEILYLCFQNKNIKINSKLIYQKFGNLILSHFEKADSFIIKSRTMQVLSYMDIEEIIPNINTFFYSDSILLGDSAVALARLIKNEKESQKLRENIVNFLKSTNDDTIRRLLRKALYIIDYNEISPNKNIIYNISDLGSNSLSVSLNAEKTIKNNMALYSDILINTLIDEEDIIIYKISSILANYSNNKINICEKLNSIDKDNNPILYKYSAKYNREDYEDDNYEIGCEILKDIFIDVASGKYVRTNSYLYSPIIKNFIKIAGNSKNEKLLPALERLLNNNVEFRYIAMKSLLNYGEKTLIKNNIHPIKQLKQANPYISKILEYYYNNRDFDEIINLLTINDDLICKGSILYLKESYFDDKYLKINRIAENIKNNEIKNLVYEHLLRETL